jgi:hypothetical protein
MALLLHLGFNDRHMLIESFGAGIKYSVHGALRGTAYFLNIACVQFYACSSTKISSTPTQFPTDSIAISHIPRHLDCDCGNTWIVTAEIQGVVEEQGRLE